MFQLNEESTDMDSSNVLHMKLSLCSVQTRTHSFETLDSNNFDYLTHIASRVNSFNTLCSLFASHTTALLVVSTILQFPSHIQSWLFWSTLEPPLFYAHNILQIVLHLILWGFNQLVILLPTDASHLSLHVWYAKENTYIHTHRFGQKVDREHERSVYISPLSPLVSIVISWVLSCLFFALIFLFIRSICTITSH